MNILSEQNRKEADLLESSLINICLFELSTFNCVCGVGLPSVSEVSEGIQCNDVFDVRKREVAKTPSSIDH